ncbi:TerD family protein [Streptomyces sp. 5-8]|uniref:TerD family protein n=1 Tax=Streptomyces musisoli TaxID=2802280 RepID=A0ABS1P961_9ACTN|nr:CAP domain-containing protein [Streptomyces musisoli]MBL1108920.1 TerD family protein [Streptomyces musisoli]
MGELVPGGNAVLPDGAVRLRVAGAFDVSALVTGGDGKVGGDADFVFYNQPDAPGVRLRGDTLTVDPARLRRGACRVTVVVSAAEPGTPLGRLPAPRLDVTDGAGRAVAGFAPPRPGAETVLLLAELYLRPGIGWKLRAIGQGYADGLAGLARDFGVDVSDDGERTATATPRHSPSSSGASPADRNLSGGASPADGLPRGATPADNSFTRGTSQADAGFRRRASPADRNLSGGASPADGLPRGASPADRNLRRGVSPVDDGFIRVVNAARAEVGSLPVVPDPRLVSAARAHARAMAGAGRLGAEGPDGVSVHQRISAAGYTYLAVGEHLVSGPRTPTGFVEYCLGTERTRRTLLDPAFRHAALAHADAGDRFWTALWASPLTPAGLTRTAAEVLALTNTERGRAGLPPLAADPLLTAAAQAHSADMVARDFYAHTAPDGSEPWDRAAAAGARRRTIGENIACGQRSAAEVVTDWMNSPGHRANILKRDFTHLGVGFAGGGRAGTYWTQLFGG